MSSNWSRKSQPWYTNRPGAETYTASPPPARGDLIRSIRIDELEGQAEKYAHLTTVRDARTVTSYNWLDKGGAGPNIFVPGRPPVWTPQSNPSRLKEDSGSYFRDKNAARYPKHPMEPAVVASLAADDTIPAEVDIMACGSTFGNLLRFVRGQNKSCRMLVYKLGRTVFLVRRENSPTELIPGVRGFGHTFPEANTTWEADVRGSASHQRVLRYSFGGLELLVRFEADGYIKPTSSKSTPSQSPPNNNPATTLDDLTGSLSTTTISPPSFFSSSSLSSSPALSITPAGALTPQSTLLDLKTRSTKTRYERDHLAEELPRLWIAQIPTFILAFHTRGLFLTQDIEIRDVRDEVKKWEEEHSKELAMLAGLLHWIREVVQQEGGEEGRVEIFLGQNTDGKLEVRKVVGAVGGVVSEGVREQWERSGKDGGVEEKGGDSGRSDGEKGVDGEGHENGLAWDDEETPDYTACSAEECGYCGRCDY
ncbi:hypothetical protein VTI74DRAFT_5108 [Chaetomium olivicolor]